MAFDQTRPAANGPMASTDVRNNFQYLKDAIAKEHNWNDTDANAITHKLSVLKGKQLFASSGIFVVPEGATKVWVSLAGGGGGGGGGRRFEDEWDYDLYTGGGGGGGDAKIAYPVTGLTPGQSITVTVGAGGYGGGIGGYGGAGGTSSFGAYVSCPGGGGGCRGHYDSGNYYYGGAAGGPGGSSGQLGVKNMTADFYSNSNCGGGCIFGAGSGSGAGGHYGGGGAGTSDYGGTGASGFVLVEW